MALHWPSPFLLWLFLASLSDGTQGQEYEYRSYDGSGNNLNNPQWGAAGQPFTRYRSHLPQYQSDNASIVNTTNVRLISNVLATLCQKRMGTRFVNDAHSAWGQFIALDLFMPLPNASDPADIDVPRCDPWLDHRCNGDVSLPFHRSAYTLQDPVRQPLNNASSFLDGSVIYGTDRMRAAALRSFVGGMLKNNSAGEAPPNTAGLYQYNPLGQTAATLRMTGDPRGNISPQVLAYISLFIREHNRYCQVLAAANPTWDDEKLYQEARRRVIAHIQFITIKEYLPALLGGPLVLYAGYNASVDPTIENFFAAGASRYGIAEMAGEVLRLTKNYVASPSGHLSLRQSIYNPAAGLQDGVEPVLRGMTFNMQERVEPNVEDDARNHWLENPGVTPPLDLFALTIQQSRDHGLPAYNEMRQLYGLPAVAWTNLTADSRLAKALQRLYPGVDQLDAVVGALAEDIPRGSVGNLIRASIKEQFLRLRTGDRFWYENNQFDDDELATIQSTSLSDIVNRNTAIGWPYPLFFFRHDGQADGGFFQTPLAVSSDLEAQYTYSLQLSSGFWLYWSVDHTQQTISFAINVRTNGFVGIGFIKRSADKQLGTHMSHVDIVCGRRVNGTGVVDDYFSFEIGAPSLDTALGCSGDLLNTSLEVVDGVRTMRFTRQFATEDSTVARGHLVDGDDTVKKAQVVKCDTEFVVGQEYFIIWAFHPTSDAWAYHLANRGVGKATLIPYTREEAPMSFLSTASHSSSEVVWIAVSIGGGILSVVVLVIVTFALHQKQKRLQNAPRSTPFCLMFTDIEQSTLLWSTDPIVMAEVIEGHNAIIRRIITQHKAYEVKTIGDAFMIAVQEPAAAVHIAVDIQLELFRRDWSPAALDLLQKVFPLGHNCGGTPDFNETISRLPWNGPRVRIGLHYVAPDARIAVELDRTSGRLDYFGPPVNTAARVESAASGGQILATSALVAACPELYGNTTLLVEDLGPITVKGIAQPINVHQISPIQLSNRMFPNLHPGNAPGPKARQTIASARELTLSPLAQQCMNLPGSVASPPHSERLSCMSSMMGSPLGQAMMVQRMKDMADDCEANHSPPMGAPCAHDTTTPISAPSAALPSDPELHQLCIP